MTSSLLAAVQVLADAGIRTVHTLDGIGERVRALIDPEELPLAARCLDLPVEVIGDPDGWTWGVMVVRGVEVRAGFPPVG